MFSFFYRGGYGMWLFLIIWLVLIFIVVKKIIDFLHHKDLNKFQLEKGINALFFWGGIAVIIGFYFHFQGLYNAMRIIANAYEISPQVVAEGYQQSLITVLTGLFTFFMSSILWFLFRWKLKTLEAKTS